MKLLHVEQLKKLIRFPIFPLEWYYQFYGYDSNISSIWGYKELVLGEKHHDDLMEREDNAIRIFLKNKKEIDEYCE
jgi:hypothetical protein